jgi:hypothetical protein
VIQSATLQLCCAGIFAILFLPAVGTGEQQVDACSTCASAMGVDRLTLRVRQFTDDIHAVSGFGCVSCQGGDATIAGMETMDREKRSLDRPTPASIIQLCGRYPRSNYCH